MVNISDNFIKKSQSPGRKIKCVIIAGNLSFTDKEILSFEFNDVTHPDDMNFGTACANRFHFELWSRQNIPLTTVIKPFIGFEDSNELCPLGEFYITRRYRKRERYSVACYDKMYRLDSKYKINIAPPYTTKKILDDIAKENSFTTDFDIEDDKIESIPRNATSREILGYIAGLNGGFAKFDRYGVLRLKKLENCGVRLERSDYSELSLKADKQEIRSVEFAVDEDIYSQGKGTLVTTYRQYNPFGSEEAARRVFEMWDGFTYRGLTLKMKGLPYLESGDSILIQDDFDDEYHYALISDYTLEYDGGLRATLTSKSKNPIDDFDEPSSRKQIETLHEQLRIRYHTYKNEDIIHIGEEPTDLASINFSMDMGANAVFNSQFTISSVEDCTLILFYYLNNQRAGQVQTTSLFSCKPLSVSLYNCFQNVGAGKCTLTLMGSIVGGNAFIDVDNLQATVSGQYMAGDGNLPKPEINVSQIFDERYTVAKFKPYESKTFNAQIENIEYPHDSRRALSEKLKKQKIKRFNLKIKGEVNND